MESGNGYWFTSSLFEAEPGEEVETNPRMYGRQPANWLRPRLSAFGYDVEEVFGEDWGWCVMCQRKPYSLWVACVNLRDYEHAKEGDPPPPKERLLWNVVPMAEAPFFKSLFGSKPDLSAGVAKLDVELLQVLEAEPAIQIVGDDVAKTWFNKKVHGA